MKTTRHLFLIAMLMCSLGMGFMACSNDDGDKVDNRIETEGGKTFVPDSLLTDLERRQMAYQYAIISIMKGLTDADMAKVFNGENVPFNITYGMALDGESSMVRAKKSKSTEEAEELFRAIAGVDDESADLLLRATPDGYELSLRDLPILPDGKLFNFGTLTFHRDGGPRRYGYVEVDIPYIPHLERIDYLSAEAFPDNADCPYQIGDIVYVPSGNNLCSGYYVCVANNGYRSTLVHMRHGVNPGGDESINADGDNEGCWKPYNNNHGHSTSFEDIKDYVSFMLENKAKVSNIKTFLNDEAYNMKPSESGKLRHIFPENFNNDQGVAYSGGANAYIYYNAYITDEYAWVPAYNYRMAEYARVPSGCDKRSDVVSGSKKYVKDKEWNNWVGSHEFTMNVIHTDGLVRGSTLEFSPTKESLLMGHTATAVTTNQLGWCYADDGILYENAAKAEKYGHKPLGIVAFVNTGKGKWMDLVTEKDRGFGHGLVLSYYWANQGQVCSIYPKQSDAFNEDNGFDHYIDNKMKSIIEDFDGLTRTEMLEMAGSPAAKAAMEMTPSAPAGITSGWFIPSAGQWLAMLCNDRQGGRSGLGNVSWPSETGYYTADIEGTPITKINKYIYWTLDGQYVWITSASGVNKCIYLRTTNNPFFFDGPNKENHVRPVFAF